jgi:hypothetical protein
MKTITAGWAARLLTLTLVLATGVLDASSKEADAAMARDGLQKITVDGIEVAYARPGASLAGYKRLMLDPMEVSLDKSWHPTRTGSTRTLNSRDREKIRAEVAAIIEDAFVKEIRAKGSYPVVTETAPDVLRVKASVVNVSLAAPDTGNVAGTNTYVRHAGVMTLMAELYDSASGQVLARIADRHEANDRGRIHIANDSFNEGEVRIIATEWADILLHALDKAHGIGSK